MLVGGLVLETDDGLAEIDRGTPFGALINAIAPEISKFVAEHPDIAVNGYALLTTIANAINPGRVKSIEANS